MWIRRVFKANGLDLIALLEAAIIQQDEPFVQSGVDAALLATLMQYVSQPLLRVRARRRGEAGVVGLGSWLLPAVRGLGRSGRGAWLGAAALAALWPLCCPVAFGPAALLLLRQ